MGEPLDAHTVAERLADRIETLAALLLPSGAYGTRRRSWRCGGVDGSAGSACVVWLQGAKRGRWRDYKAGQGGDALDLVAQTQCGGDLARGYAWALDWLGLRALSSAETARLKEEAERARVRRQREGEREARHNASDAKQVWLAAAPLIPDDLAWRYLAGRGIDLALLPIPPAALRLHRGLYNPEAQRALPALVAAICAPDGSHINTHRIWLAEDAAGRVTKARLAKPKLSMEGGYAGGCVRLWKGSGGRPWNHMPAGETLLAGEGIEDVMTVVCARPEWRACAILSVSSLAGLVLPPMVTTLIWLAQNDPKGSPAEATLRRALAAHRAQGRQVLTLRPPVFVKDINDYGQWLKRAPLVDAA